MRVRVLEFLEPCTYNCDYISPFAILELCTFLYIFDGHAIILYTLAYVCTLSTQLVSDVIHFTRTTYVFVYFSLNATVPAI